MPVAMVLGAALLTVACGAERGRRTASMEGAYERDSWAEATPSVTARGRGASRAEGPRNQDGASLERQTPVAGPPSGTTAPADTLKVQQQPRAGAESAPEVAPKPAPSEEASKGKIGDAPGLAILRNDCLGCHSESLVRQQRLTDKQWTKVIEKMQRWGAETEPENVETLTAYLAEKFGRSAGAYDPASMTADEARAAFSALPDGPYASGKREHGLELYRDQCAACHGEDAHGGPQGLCLAGRHILDQPAVFAAILRAGRARMPAYETTTDREIADLLAYLRSLTPIQGH